MTETECGVYLFCYAITQDSSSDEDCRDTDIKKRLDRSAQLTPIEQQLVAELDSLPKPKRKRKHKRKKSQRQWHKYLQTKKEKRRKNRNYPKSPNP